jgi:glycosyltransferase involved in cell wall biosynthesis
MHIVLVTRALDFGGAERQLVQLANGLAQRGHRVTVITFYPGSAFDGTLHQPNPALIVLGKRGRWDLAGFLWRFARRMRALDPDVIYGFLPVPNMLAVLAGTLVCRGAAVVCGVRGTELESARYDWLERLTNRLQHRILGSSDLVIANSVTGADWLRRTGLAESRIAVVRNGIDTEAIRPATPDARIAARQCLGCEAEAFIVAVVARIDPMKDHATFLHAFARAVAAEPGIQALIVGDGPSSQAAKLREQAEALGIDGRLIWTAARHDVTIVYHAADLVCLPSAFGEGFPNILAEAMSAGLPCVATGVGDSAAVLGPFGRVVPARDATAMASALLDTVRAGRRETADGWQLRRHVIETFGIEEMIVSTEKLLLQASRHQKRLGK